MGCVSSKLICKEDKKKKRESNYTHHVVSLTSTTYGLLNLEIQRDVKVNKSSSSSPSPSPTPSPPCHEIINVRELMEGLQDQDKSKSPFKLLVSPRKVIAGRGKENKPGLVSKQSSPKTVLKDSNANFKKPSPRLWASVSGKTSESNSRRRSLGPLFEPKKDDGDHILESYEKMQVMGGENAVIIYTTTLRGIRKTFEECNVARSTMESHNVEVRERDMSMHSAFKEELRQVMKGKEVRLPAVFVKGRYIGGAQEVVKLEEDGKLGILLTGIAKAVSPGCTGCGGIRFMVCVECSGSCKVFDGNNKCTFRCSKCNENGLVECPFCCSLVTKPPRLVIV